MKIISGGQTGVDRAALDAAMKHGIACGGWCPAGRQDEFGRIPDHYPVHELSDGGEAERTLQNVIDSDATVIFYHDKIVGGTEHTLRCCNEHGRPRLLIAAAKVSSHAAANLILDFVRRENIEILNVAGPRQTEWPDGYNYSFAALERFLAP